MKLSDIYIERLAIGGNGVGKIEGKVCFVPFSAPGDRLKVRILKEHHSYCEAELVELHEASSLRINPLCPAFGLCGGCNWQHIEYSGQCNIKQSLLAETIQRTSGIIDPNVAKTAPSVNQYGYRARAQFKLHSTESGLAVGFFRRGSHYVIDLPDGCPVVRPAINRAMKQLRQILQNLPDNNRIPQVTMEEGISGVVAIVHYIGSDHKGMIKLLQKEKDRLPLAGVFLQTGRKDSILPVFGDGDLEFTVPRCGDSAISMNLGYKIGGFSQINREQNRVMVNLVCGYARPEESHRLLDLYCGNGNLSLPISEKVQELLAVEGFAPSIASAVDNARQHHVNNSTFKCNDVVSELRQLVSQKARFDTILLDPPRTGAVEAVRSIGALGAKSIVYVSCDPATMARDITILCKSSGYRLIEATPLDMFPQTAHIETVALLSNSD